MWCHSVQFEPCEMGSYGKWSLILLEQMAAQGVATYERWSPMRGFNCSDFIERILVFWKSGHRQEVAGYERWSHGEVWLYKLSVYQPKTFVIMGSCSLSILEFRGNWFPIGLWDFCNTHWYLVSNHETGTEIIIINNLSSYPCWGILPSELSGLMHLSQEKIPNSQDW